MRSRWPKLEGHRNRHQRRRSATARSATKSATTFSASTSRHARFAEAVRGHWGIENRLHWQLDVTFQEDQCRIRKGHADANFSILRRTALSCSKTSQRHKVGIKNKRLAAGWDETYLEKVLVGT